MQLLLSILLWLGVINPNSQMYMEQVNNFTVQNIEVITTISNDPTLSTSIIDQQQTAVTTVRVIDWNE